MDFLDKPDEKLWNDRKNWIEKLMEDEAGLGGYDISEHACALMMDMEAVFCTGAWVAVIILSMSIIDAQLREVEAPEFHGNTEKLLKETGFTNTVDWLRIRRNNLVHINKKNPEITVDYQWDKRVDLETEARKAIELVCKVVFNSPFI